MKHLTKHFGSRVVGLNINFQEDEDLTWGASAPSNLILKVRKAWFEVSTPEEIDAVLRFALYTLADELVIYEPLEAAKLAFFSLGFQVPDPTSWVSPDGVVAVHATDKDVTVCLGNANNPKKLNVALISHLEKDGNPLRIASLFRGLEVALSHWLFACYDLKYSVYGVLYEFKAGVLHETPTAHHTNLVLP